MDFKQKLERYAAHSAPPVPVAHLIAELRNRIADVAARHAPSASAPDRVELPGQRSAGQGGELRRIVEYMAPDHCHGRVPIASSLAADPEMVAMLALDPALAGLDLSRAVFLDTETTGLSGGTGTIPFLVGLAWFEDSSLCVEQLFLESPGEEAPLLEALRARLLSASCIVSYNGKAFDWPLLVTRAVLARVAPPPIRPHVDLLHMARRCFKRRLGSVRLVDVECGVLGMFRERDIDGAEIPSLYWSYLRHRDAAAMLPVLEHNRNDLIALAALLGLLSARAQRLHMADEPEDHLALAEVAYRAKRLDKAFEFGRAAFEGGGPRDLTVRAALLYAELLAKKQDVAEAVAVLDHALIAAGGDRALSAPVHLVLAKLWEHKLKDPARASIHARGAGGAEPDDEAAHRQARLERKITRASNLPAPAQAPRRRRAPRVGSGFAATR